jgi:hypothetical protein
LCSLEVRVHPLNADDGDEKVDFARKKLLLEVKETVVLVVMQKLGIEPRFSRPQRDVLTTGRFLPDEPKHRADFDERCFKMTLYKHHISAMPDEFLLKKKDITPLVLHQP